jgi:hypothetical protein
MVRGIAERLVDVAGDIGVECDHFADGHLLSFARPAKQNCLRSFFCGLLGSHRFPDSRKQLRLAGY